MTLSELIKQIDEKYALEVAFICNQLSNVICHCNTVIERSIIFKESCIRKSLEDI